MPKATPPESGNRPVHSIRHRRLKATIWRNATEKGTMYNVIVTRSYRDKQTNDWRDTHSIGYDDLMNIVALLHEAYRYISDRIGKEVARSKSAVSRATLRPSSRIAAPSTPEQQLPF